ncbi:hypothetical protein KSP39_PZI005870 [Platanthera zijinensis]|uniref:Protein CHUP1, chloroplastic n=1 Tax=Platanthera zijinensis TaxID=2320716 RepID=A0AAP0BU36_9ASPA
MAFERGDWEDSMAAGRKMAKPFIWKTGLALFLTLTGFFAARHRPRRRIISSPPPHSHSPSDAEPGESVGALEEELPICQPTHECEEEEALAKITPRAPVSVEDDLFLCDFESSEEEEFPGFVIPDLNNSIQRETETDTEILPSVPLTSEFERRDLPAMEEEISDLRNLVQCLQEREKYLEMQLLKFHGFKEQEISMRELQNRLKISYTETNLLSLKIESLNAENEKLRSKVAEFSRVTTEVEILRKNITTMKSKMETVGEEAREKIMALHARISELGERERKDLEDSVQVEKKMKRLNELEDEVSKLQMEKSVLENEKLELMKRLPSDHILSPLVIRSPDFVVKSPELRSLEEVNFLREENSRLKKEMEQIQTDQCMEIEELIYLRWVNACLRYELKNYPFPLGKTTARDLSRSSSLNSEQKVKQLILDYSNSGFNPNQKSLTDFNFDDLSSQESNEECDENSLACSKSKSRKPGKSKFIGKLKKLVLGKSGRAADASSSDGNSERMAGRKLSDSISCLPVERGSGNSSSGRKSFDTDDLRRLKLEGVRERMSARSKSDLGEVYERKSMVFVRGESFCGSTFNSFADEKEGVASEKMKLVKFARAFKNSQELVNLSGRPESLSSG